MFCFINVFKEDTSKQLKQLDAILKKKPSNELCNPTKKLSLDQTTVSKWLTSIINIMHWTCHVLNSKITEELSKETVLLSAFYFIEKVLLSAFCFIET